MPTVQVGDRVRVITTVYSNPVGKVGILATPGQIAVIEQWVNAGTVKVHLEGTNDTFLLRNVECQPLQ